jgi:hypothetical protein
VPVPSGTVGFFSKTTFAKKNMHVSMAGKERENMKRKHVVVEWREKKRKT